MPRKAPAKRVRVRRSAFSNVTTAPWVPLRLMLSVTGTAEAATWQSLSNKAVQERLYEQLGFRPTSEKYLEVRYQRAAFRAGVAGAPLSIRLYQIFGSGADSHPNVMVSRMSVPRFTTEYVEVDAAWDARSRSVSMTGVEENVIAAVYTGKGSVFIALDILYKHTETPATMHAATITLAGFGAAPPCGSTVVLDPLDGPSALCNVLALTRPS